MTIRVEMQNRICIVTIDRPEHRNAVDESTAQALYEAFTNFEQDDSLDVAILTGVGNNFCAGADLKAISKGMMNPLYKDMSKIAPMGPSRLLLTKPVIAAIEGYAVAGGLELAIWCDLRIVAEDAVFGVFCRRFGVPLIDGGTQRLPLLIGFSNAMDMILTGRPVDALEAKQMGLANRIVPTGHALQSAIELAKSIVSFPPLCMRSDRLAMYDGIGLAYENRLQQEFEKGLQIIQSGETLQGATSFLNGQGKNGQFN